MLDQGADLISQQRFAVLGRTTQFDRLFLMSHDAANVILEAMLTLRHLLRSGQRHRYSPGHPEGRARISYRDLARAVAVYP